MVIRSEELPFRVTFCVDHGGQQITLPVTVFTDSQEELLERRFVGVELREDTKYQLAFEATAPAARLYLDILDSLPVESSGLHLDEENVPYMFPGGPPVNLYLGDYVPWIPSLYYLCVRTGADTYYSTVWVKPKLVTQDQLNVMRDELRRDLEHLVFQLARRSLSDGEGVVTDTQRLELLKLDNLLPFSSQLIAAATDLADRPNFRIARRYERVPEGMASEVDQRALRMMASWPKHIGHAIALRRELSYDLPENCWVVRIAEVLRQFLERSMDVLDAHQQSLERAIEEAQPYLRRADTIHKQAERQRALDAVHARQRTVRKMLHVLRYLSMAPWFQALRGSTAGTRLPAFTHVLVQEPRYRVFYEAYRVVREDDIEIRMHPSYTLEWRPTNELYELWTFVRIAKELAAQGFRLQPPDFAGSARDGRIYVEALKPGATLVFERDDVTLRLAYDVILPMRAEGASLQQPLYTTQRHNRPDGLLHVYKQGVFWGSIVFDAKYRRVHNFWDLDAPLSDRPHAMDQLCAYEGGFKSPFLYGSGYSKNMKPVYEVWALHPKGDVDVEDIPDYAVKLVRLTPGESNAHLGVLLADAVERILSMGIQNVAW